MKKLLAVFAVLFNANAIAQIPVTDAASIANHTAAQVETIAKWALQNQQMVQQINQLQASYESLNGSRNLGLIMNDPRYRNYLPDNWQGVYDSVRQGGYAGLTGNVKQSYESNKVYDGCQKMLNAIERQSCEAQAVKGYQDKENSKAAFDASLSRIGQIDKLMSQINVTKDPKAIAELQARISAEQAMIQNEQTKLQMFQQISQAEDKIIEQRKREANAQRLDKTGFTTPPLLNLNN